MEIWVGIDISAETFDAAWVDETGRHHLKIVNKPEQFPKLLTAVPRESNFVMEATGTYYLKLALFLSEEARNVSVVKPLHIKNHCRADMARSKNDTPDAYTIGRNQQLRALAVKVNM